MRHAIMTAMAWGVIQLSAAAAAPSVEQRLAQAPPAYTADNAFMGAVLVARDGKVLLNKGYGSANLDWAIPNTPDVKFRLGSLTKQFTATLILKLQEDGKLSIDDPVSRYIPDVPATWRAITLKQLLGHTSGINDFTDRPVFRTWSLSPHTSADLLKFVEEVPGPDFPSGTKFVYSNSNYEVLGAVIEKVTGRPYVEVLKTRILNPLGMGDTGLDSDDLILPKRALGYRQDEKVLTYARSESLSVPWAAGSMYSTTGDLLKWETALFGGQVLSPASLKLMTTRTHGDDDYGLGVALADRHGADLIEHTGGIEGFSTDMIYARDKKLVVVVLGNVQAQTPSILGDQLLQIALGESVVLPSEHADLPVSPQIGARLIGTYADPRGDLVVTLEGDRLVLTRASNGHTFHLHYEGVVNGHPTAWSPEQFFRVEFGPGAEQASSLTLRFPSRTTTSPRKAVLPPSPSKCAALRASTNPPTCQQVGAVRPPPPVRSEAEEPHDTASRHRRRSPRKPRAPSAFRLRGEPEPSRSWRR